MIRPLGVVTILLGLIVISNVTVPSPADGADIPKYSYGNDTCTKRSDPVTAVFYGSAATDNYLNSDPYKNPARGDIEHHTGWSFHGGEKSQWTWDYGTCQISGTEQPASAFGAGNSRWHIRLWQLAQRDDRGRWETVGTPHHEDWVNWPSCSKFPGSHAVDKGAVDTDNPSDRTRQGSGFDQGRRKLAGAFNTRHHEVSYHDGRNTRSVVQCDGDPAGSNGNVAWISVGRH